MGGIGEKNYTEGTKIEIMIVPNPYTFESESNILRKDGRIVKNCWSVNPTQEELDKIISDIEAAIKFLEGNS